MKIISFNRDQGQMPTSNKKSVRFGEAIEIIDCAQQRCSDDNKATSTTTTTSSFTTASSRGGGLVLPIPSWMETLITKRPSWPKSSTRSSTWYTSDEMNEQFLSDLEDAQIWKVGCFRGLEHYLEDDTAARRRDYIAVFVRAVVQKSRDLKQQQQQQQQQQEGHLVDSSETSLSSSVGSRASSSRRSNEKIDSAYVESYLGRYSAKHSKQSKKLAIRMGREDEVSAYRIHYDDKKEQDDTMGAPASSTDDQGNNDERLYTKSILGSMGKNCNTFAMLRSSLSLTKSSSKRNAIVAKSA